MGYSPGVLMGRVVGTPSGGTCEENEGWRDSLTRLTFVGADGTEYELVDKLTMGVAQATYYNGDCSIGYNFNRGKEFVTRDGSGVTFNSDDDIMDAYGFFIERDMSLRLPADEGRHALPHWWRRTLPTYRIATGTG